MTPKEKEREKRRKLKLQSKKARQQQYRMYGGMGKDEEDGMDGNIWEMMGQSTRSVTSNIEHIDFDHEGEYEQYEQERMLRKQQTMSSGQGNISKAELFDPDQDDLDIDDDLNNFGNLDDEYKDPMYLKKEAEKRKLAQLREKKFFQMDDQYLNLETNPYNKKIRNELTSFIPLIQWDSKMIIEWIKQDLFYLSINDIIDDLFPEYLNGYMFLNFIRYPKDVTLRNLRESGIDNWPNKFFDSLWIAAKEFHTKYLLEIGINKIGECCGQISALKIESHRLSHILQENDIEYDPEHAKEAVASELIGPKLQELISAEDAKNPRWTPSDQSRLRTLANQLDSKNKTSQRIIKSLPKYYEALRRSHIDLRELSTRVDIRYKELFSLATELTTQELMLRDLEVKSKHLTMEKNQLLNEYAKAVDKKNHFLRELHINGKLPYIEHLEKLKAEIQRQVDDVTLLDYQKESIQQTQLLWYDLIDILCKAFSYNKEQEQNLWEQEMKSYFDEQQAVNKNKSNRRRRGGTPKHGRNTSMKSTDGKSSHRRSGSIRSNNNGRSSIKKRGSMGSKRRISTKSSRPISTKRKSKRHGSISSVHSTRSMLTSNEVIDVVAHTHESNLDMVYVYKKMFNYFIGGEYEQEIQKLKVTQDLNNESNQENKDNEQENKDNQQNNNLLDAAKNVQLLPIFNKMIDELYDLDDKQLHYVPVDIDKQSLKKYIQAGKEAEVAYAAQQKLEEEQLRLQQLNDDNKDDEKDNEERKKRDALKETLRPKQKTTTQQLEEIQKENKKQKRRERHKKLLEDKKENGDDKEITPSPFLKNEVITPTPILETSFRHSKIRQPTYSQHEFKELKDDVDADGADLPPPPPPPFHDDDDDKNDDIIPAPPPPPESNDEEEQKKYKRSRHQHKQSLMNQQQLNSSQWNLFKKQPQQSREQYTAAQQNYYKQWYAYQRGEVGHDEWQQYYQQFGEQWRQYAYWLQWQQYYNSQSNLRASYGNMPGLTANYSQQQQQPPQPQTRHSAASVFVQQAQQKAQQQLQAQDSAITNQIDSELYRFALQKYSKEEVDLWRRWKEMHQMERQSQFTTTDRLKCMSINTAIQSGYSASKDEKKNDDNDVPPPQHTPPQQQQQQQHQQQQDLYRQQSNQQWAQMQALSASMKQLTNDQQQYYRQPSMQSNYSGYTPQQQQQAYYNQMQQQQMQQQQAMNYYRQQSAQQQYAQQMQQQQMQQQQMQQQQQQQAYYNQMQNQQQQQAVPPPPQQAPKINIPPPPAEQSPSPGANSAGYTPTTGNRIRGMMENEDKKRAREQRRLERKKRRGMQKLKASAQQQQIDKKKMNPIDEDE